MALTGDKGDKKLAGRIERLSQRLQDKNLGPYKRAKVQQQLFALRNPGAVIVQTPKQQAGGRLQKRLAEVEALLKQEQDEAVCAQLEQRKKRMLNKLAFKQRCNANGGCPAGLTNRLARLEAKLKTVTDPVKKAELQKRKANVEAKLAATQARSVEPVPAPVVSTEEECSEDDATASDVSMEDHDLLLTPPSTPPRAVIPASAFPGLTQRLFTIERKLQETTNPAARARLEQRKANVLAKLEQKKKQQQDKQDKTQKQDKQAKIQKNNPWNSPPRFPKLKKQIANIEAQLKAESDEARKTELERRKATLLIKLADEQSNSSCSERLDLAQELLAETQNEDRRTSLQERVVHLKEAVDKQQQTNNIKLNHQREKQKQRLIQMEKTARANNEQALTRIALQQVYVAHYPDSAPHYVPVFGKGQDVLTKRAALRAQAIQAVHANTNARVDWISPDMYQRLPRNWTLDDEIAMFGTNNKNTIPASDSEPLEDSFVNLQLQNIIKTDPDDAEGWTQVNANVDNNEQKKKSGRGKNKQNKRG